MNKNPHGRILKEKPKEQYLITVPKSCHILKCVCEYVESYKLVKRLIWRSYFNKILFSLIFITIINSSTLYVCMDNLILKDNHLFNLYNSLFFSHFPTFCVIIRHLRS